MSKDSSVGRDYIMDSNIVLTIELENINLKKFIIFLKC